MPRVNKILVSFLLVVAISFFAIWKLVQSESFANLFSNSITEISREKFGFNVSFDKLTFKFFPPGAELHNVKVKKNDSDNIKFQALKAGISFDLLDSFETDLTIKRIYLHESSLEIKKLSSKKTDTNNKISPKKIVNNFFQILDKKIPVKLRNIQIVDLKLKLDDRELYIRNLDAEISKEQVDLFTQVDDINVEGIFKKDILIDRVSADLNLKKDKLLVRNFNVKERYNDINLSGEINIAQNISDLKYDFKASGTLDLPDLHDYVDIASVGSIYEGTATVNCKSKGNIETFNGNCNLKLLDFDSDFAYGEEATLSISLNNQNIVFEEFSLHHQNQKMTLLKPFSFYDLKKNSFFLEPIRLVANEVKFDNALRIVRKQLSQLKGSINGEVSFTRDRSKLIFTLGDKTQINNLSLQSDKSQEIIGVKKLLIDRAEFLVDGTDVLLEIESRIDRSKLKVRGGIVSSVASFHLHDSFVDFEELNDLAGFKIKGHGPLELKINSPLDNVMIGIEASVNNFDFEGYQIDTVNAQINLDLKNGVMALKKITGKQGRSEIKADGAINLNTLELGMEVRHSVLFYNDLRKIYYPLQKDLTFLPERFLGEMKASFTLGGKANLEDLKVFGNIQGKNLYAYNESFDSLNIEFILNNKILNFRKIEINKSHGQLLGLIGINLDTSEVSIRGNVKSLNISELNNFLKLPIKIKGRVDGNYYIIIDKEIKLFDAQVYVNNSSIEGTKVGKSYVDMRYGENIVKIKGQLFDNAIRLNSSLDIAEKFWSVENHSSVNVNIGIDHLERYLPILDGINDTNNFQGKAWVEVTSQFNFSNWKSLSLFVMLDELMLKKSNVDFHYKASRDKEIIVVSKGEIESWDVDLRGKNFYLISKASGNFLSDYEINTKLKVDASILEVFDGVINQASGMILGKLTSYKKNKDENYEATITSNNLSLSTDFIPTDVKPSQIRLSLKDKQVKLDKFLLTLNNGNIDVSGFVNFQHIIPEMSLKYQINQAEFNLLKKTTVELDGSGSIIGSNKPYNVSGDIVVTKAQVLNEFNEFDFGSSVGSKKVKYLPESSALGINNLFTFNVSVATREPVQLNNSIAKLAFNANLQLLGSEVEPRLSGKVALAGGTNFLDFQNNEFKIVRGDIFFSELQPMGNPEVDFVATSTIAKYNVSARVYGPISDYNTSLTSDPVLPQQNILSLIAFGYTEDVSESLSDVEKESITRAGIGSLIFDSFKINQALKNEFGVQVNVGTDISQVKGSYLSQRAGDSVNSVGRVRSATKIEVKKEITKDVSMSVMSTVGGTSGERQSMNLNYNINNIYSVEGVYQSQTSDEDEQDLNANSFGADFKIKWSFK